ncbi:MAG: ATP-binding protein [bacterium]|nr:ATP-binding protein [bacterium]
MKSLYTLNITPNEQETDAEVVSRISESLEDIGQDQEWPPKLVYLVNLSVEEFGLNALTHGRKHGLDEFEITISSDSELITIELSDNGAAFDPMNDAPEPDFETPLESRPIGGLGIYLIKKMVDAMEYRRDYDRNYLRLTVRRT